MKQKSVYVKQRNCEIGNYDVIAPNIFYIIKDYM